MKKINIGIIGAGKISEEYIKACKLKPDNINIAGIVGKTSRNAYKLSKKYSIKFSNNNIVDFLKLDLDIIIVAVNITSVLDVVKKLKDFKKIILFEKPLGINYKETNKIYKYLKKNKENCFIALNRRFYEGISKAFTYLKADKSKKIITIFDQQDLKIAKKIGHPKIVLKNWMYANSIHLIDLLFYFGNSDVKKIITEKHNMKKEKFIFSKIYFKNGNIGYYNSFWNRPGSWIVTLSSSKYFFEFNPLEKTKIKFNSIYKKNFQINEKSPIKPGFIGLISALINNFQLKRLSKKIIKKNFSSNGLPDLEEYLKLSDIVRRIYNL